MMISALLPSVVLPDALLQPGKRLRTWQVMGVCLLICLLQPGLLRAQDTEGSQETEADQQARLLSEQNVAAMRRQLEDFRNRLGPYAPELMEVQQDLVRELLALGWHEEAAAVSTEALQLARVTDGLYSERQLDILSNLRDAYIGLQDWEKVDDYQHLKFTLQSRYYPADSAEYADALLERASWQLQASQLNLLGRPGSSSALQQLQDMNEAHQQALDIAYRRGDTVHQWELLSAIAMTEIELARHYNYQEMNEMMLMTPRYITQTVCRTVADGAGGAQRVCWQERVQNPEYNHSVASQRRMNLERSRLNVQNSQRHMEAFLQENPDFAATHPDRVNPRMDNIRQAVVDMQRTVRRASMREW